MAPMTLGHKDVVWFDRHAHEWVDAGLVSDQQVDAIRHFEHLDEQPSAPLRLTVAVEAASYLGSSLALAGGAVMVGRSWDELGLVGQLLVAFAVSAVGFAAGSWILRLGEAGAARLGSFLWTIGTGGVVMAIVVVHLHVETSAAWLVALSIGAPVLVIGLVLWRNLNRPLQMLTALAGLAATVGGLVDLSGIELSTSQVAAAVWASAVVFGVLAALDRVNPKLVALVVALVVAFFAATSLVDSYERLGPALAAFTTAVVVVYSLRQSLIVLLGLSLLGFLIAVTVLIEAIFSGVVAGLVAALLGLLIVVVAVFRTSHGHRVAG
jgi:hypothetical protein